MKKLFILTIFSLWGIWSYAQAKQSLDIQISNDPGIIEICQLRGEKPKFIMSYDWLDSPLVVTMVNHKPIANKPYRIFIRHHSLIIFCRGVKIGAVKWMNKPYQLTDLKLN